MAVIASRPELPASFHSSSYSPSASPRIRPASEHSQRERLPSTASAHQPTTSSSYRQSWASDSSVHRPRSVSSSSGNVFSNSTPGVNGSSTSLKDTPHPHRDYIAGYSDELSSRDQEQLDRPAFQRSHSASSSLSARRPLEPSLTANMSSKDGSRRQQQQPASGAVQNGAVRRPASDRDLQETFDGQNGVKVKNGPGETPLSPLHQYQSHQSQQQQQQHMPQQQYGYFPPPQQPWTAPQRSGSPSAGSPGNGSPMFYSPYTPPAQLPPQIQQLSPSAQQAYLQAMAAHHYQNNQAGIAAWASAYQQGMMMAAAQQNQQNHNGPYPNQNQGMPRSISTSSNTGDGEFGQHAQQRDQARSVSGASSQSGAPGYHPYRRQPSKQNIAGKERKREASSNASSARSSTGNYPEADDEVLRDPFPVVNRSDGVRARASFDDAHRARIRRGSSSSAEHVPTARIVAPSRKAVQQAVQANDKDTRASSQSASRQSHDVRPDATSDQSATRRNMHKRQNSSTSSVGEVIKPTLRTAESGASIGTITPAPAQTDGLNPAAREWTPTPSSLLAQRPSAPSDPTRSPGRSVSDGVKKEADKKEKTGLRGKLQKAMKRENEPVKITPKSPIKQAQPVITTSSSAPATLHQANDSLGSTSTTTRSTSPPVTPPQPPTPAGLGNRRPSNSSFAPSLIEPLDGRGGKPKRSLFNMRNASTDNISISSTVSSASMMIRRMGALGKIARRNSLASISKIFKDKSAEDGDIVDEPKDGKKKKFRFGKSQPSTVASSTHAHAADQDRTVEGLSPAAQLARQHTLRSKNDNKGGERNAQQPASPAGNSQVQRPSDEPYDSDDASFAENDDVTARLEDLQVGDDPRASYENSREWEENALYWGQGYVDRHAIPAKGILKSVSSYDGVSDLSAPNAPWNRARSNSTDITGQPSEPGPLAHVTDQGHIDGHRPNEAMDPFSPSFDPFEAGHDKTQGAERPGLYSNVSLNSSAPMLSLAGQAGRPPRSVTSPMPRKRLNWAPECAIYHTFHATEYDRRSEPATCNRLTPALAQEIKDELNGFKMEEMAVHPSSRIHTHFFV